jgi:4-amino-4-deoxy-L-arabinose transferase-like glycosyltransferase
MTRQLAATRPSRTASGASSEHAIRAGALFALALVLRVAFVLSVDRDGFAYNDIYLYHSIADQLAGGNGFANPQGEPTAQWPPVYPLILSLTYGLFGSEPLAGELLNALIGALTVPMLYFVALRALGRREALFSGLALAVLPGQIFLADPLLAETLYTFFLVALLALLVFLPDRRSTHMLVGPVVGVAALTRGEGLFFSVLPLAFWGGWITRRREVLRRLGVVALAAVVVMFPWIVRNAVVMDSFVPTGTNSASTLWAGHNPTADGGPTYPPRSLERRVEGLDGPEREIEWAALLRREALSYMTSHPLREAELIPQKLLSLNRGDSLAFYYWLIPDATPERAIGRDATTRQGILADAAYYALLTLFVASLVVFGRAFLRTRLLRAALAFLAVVLVLYGFVFYGNFRYRIPLEPLMILVAAPLVGRLADLKLGVTRAGEGSA